MFVLFGVGDSRDELGPGATRTCPRCHNTTTWTRVRTSRRLTVFFVPVLRWRRRELEVCGICGTATEVGPA
ncbi:zinc-ribbon domain-containing protein [Aquipuribacter sp. SD81]|uniref:zinc-ribbon domain-containing protein n=1 Tax=Aquipuribacter sp. SD81 TaxID=3127703 RepID=UPI00301A043E